VNYILGLLALLFVYFTVFFTIAQIKKNNSIVDIGWGLGFAVLSLYSLVYGLIVNGGLTLPQIFVSVAMILWGMRLFLYIGVRNFKKPEDYRYVEMRKKWGTNHPGVQAFFKVFMIQALFMLIISATLIFVYLSPSDGNLIFILIGFFVFLFGLVFESIGDIQLKRFLKTRTEPGKIMTTGLWKYTRHPNYFGETVVWWGIFIITFGMPWFFIALFSPAMITWLLLFVSGIPLLEKKAMKKPGYPEYAAKTSVFFPLPPRK